MWPQETPPFIFPELALDLFSATGKSRKTKRERMADKRLGTKILVQNQKVVLVRKQSHPGGREATQIARECEAGPSSTETNPRGEMDPFEFGHIGPSYKNFWQDQANDSLCHIRKEIIEMNGILLEEKTPNVQGCTSCLKRDLQYRVPRLQKEKNGAVSSTSRTPKGSIRPSA